MLEEVVDVYFAAFYLEIDADHADALRRGYEVDPVIAHIWRSTDMTFSTHFTRRDKVRYGRSNKHSHSKHRNSQATSLKSSQHESLDIAGCSSNRKDRIAKHTHNNRLSPAN